MSFWKAHPVVARTHPQAVFYNLSLPTLTESWQAYDFHVTKLDSKCDKGHYGLMR